MSDKYKTKEQLIKELISLHKRVSELEKLESAHREAEETMARLSAVVRDSNDAITVQKLDGTILDWNHGAELIYGWTASKAIGKKVEIIIPEDKRAEKTQMRNRIIKGETAVSFETKRITKDGRLLDIWLTLGALNDKNGRVNAISTIERDITARKRAEEALVASEAKLREQKIILEQKNVTLRELLEQIQIEKKRIMDQVHANVTELLLPMLKKLKLQKGINHRYIDLLENNLKDLTSSFGIKITEAHLKLSPREIEICNMIKSGFTSKDIARALNITSQTAERHRNNIRKKLGIVKKSINLATYMQTYSASIV